ncbi:hypothetical protein BGX30_007553 [Mortierella sp. GBA39]|nr:hypothetical protein BGX30_007553 [Mortierella sp. GBA39]
MVRILTTLLKPDGGTATVNGCDVASKPDRVRQSISLTGQFAAVDEILTGRENLIMIAKLRHLKNPRQVADRMLQRFGLTDAADRKAATYSGGMRRRLDIALSLVGNPQIIFLDEPTTGLDPEARIEVWKTVKELAGGGTTIFLTTQYLEEAEQLADSIAILHEGRIIASGTLSELKKLFPSAKVDDMGVMLGRSMRHIFRSMDTIITVCITPIAMMLLFVYVFGGAIHTGTDNYVNYLLPGILLIAIASGISYTAYRLFMDKQRGIIERFHSMPIARSAVLWGHVLTSLVSNMISLVVIILVALLMGFRSSAGVLPWLAVTGILVLFTLALTWVAAIAGLSGKSVEGASAFSYPLIFLPFISSAFVPTDSMPKVVRAFAENQPVTSIVETIRALLSNQPVGNDIWIALAWCVSIMLVAYVFAMRAYKKRA